MASNQLRREGLFACEVADDKHVIRVTSFGEMAQAFDYAVPMKLDLDAGETTGAADVVVFPSTVAVRVGFRPKVEGGSSDELSAAAVAVQRRRRSSSLRQSILALVPVRNEPDLHTYTHPVLTEIRGLYSFLFRYEQTEGNSCMILRYLRNSILNAGWRTYRSETAIQAASEACAVLSSVTTVERTHARDAMRSMRRAGLRTSLPVPLIDDEDDNGESAEIPS